MLFSQAALSFFRSLRVTQKLPKGVVVLNPYVDRYVFGLCEKFYNKYYHDGSTRTVLLGINPGRFGSGTTGISFTDPVLLEKECGIENTLLKKGELSADFIHRMIHAYGGLDQFYSKFFISSVCPLGLTKDGTNINYYDDPKLAKMLLPFILQSMQSLLTMPVSRKICYCIGEGKNIAFLNSLNDEHRWFERVIALPHPRFIMQYKRKQLDGYIATYLSRLAEAS